MKIYVGNLDYKVDEDDLKGIFEEYGTLSEVTVVKDGHNGRSKGFGFVTMDDSDEGMKAVNELNGTTLKSRELVVNEARKKKDSNNKRRY